jgi:hypothetical protein
MQPLKVVPADVHTYGNRHSDVAEQVQAACCADGPVVAAMPEGYGPIGAVFTAAVVEFEATIKTAGTQISSDYQDMSTKLHTTAGMYVTNDAANAATVRSAASGTYVHTADPASAVRSV